MSVDGSAFVLICFEQGPSDQSSAVQFAQPQDSVVEHSVRAAPDRTRFVTLPSLAQTMCYYAVEAVSVAQPSGQQVFVAQVAAAVSVPLERQCSYLKPAALAAEPVWYN